MKSAQFPHQPVKLAAFGLWCVSASLFPAHAQCVGDWDTSLARPSPARFDAGPGYLNTLIAFDDSTGVKLHTFGSFRILGGAAAQSAARLDGPSWSPLGEGLIAGIHHFASEVGQAAAVFDFDGAGPQPPRLVVGGGFAHAGNASDDYSSTSLRSDIAVWDGTQWSGLGNIDATDVYGFADPYFSGICALLPFDDGTGSKLYAVGQTGPLFHAGLGSNFRNVAYWSGSQWLPLPLFPAGPDTVPVIRDAVVHNDGAGNALYLAGRFTDLPGLPGTANIVKWDGVAGSAVAGGRPMVIDRILSLDPDGAGPQPATLFVLGGGILSRLDGAAWTEFPIPGASGYNRAAAVFDDGSGPAVFVFEDQLYKFTGAGFVVVPTDASSITSDSRFLGAIDLGSGPRLTRATDGFAYTLNGGQWNHAAPTGSKLQSLANAAGVDPASLRTSATITFDSDGAGPARNALYIGFTGLSAGTEIHGVVRFDGLTWTNIPGSFGRTPVTQFASRTGLAGPELFAFGSVNVGNPDTGEVLGYGTAFRLTSTGWVVAGTVEGFTTNFSIPPSSGWFSLVGSSASSDVYLLGGSGGGGTSAPGVSRWDGTQWTLIPGGPANAAGAIFDDGSGPALYTVDASGASKWDGTTWTSFPGTAFFPWQTASNVFVFQNALYAFGYDGGNAAYQAHISRFTGSGWMPQELPPTDPLNDLGEGDALRFIGAADAGQGERIFAARIDPYYANYAYLLFEFDGVTWTPRDNFVQFVPSSVLRFDSGNQAALWFGGASGVGGQRVDGTSMVTATGIDGSSLSRRFCSLPCPPDFNNSGAVTVQDIFDFLAAYFSNEPAADFNHSGAITVQDIFDFLAAYFTGC